MRRCVQTRVPRPDRLSPMLGPKGAVDGKILKGLRSWKAAPRREKGAALGADPGCALRFFERGLPQD